MRRRPFTLATEITPEHEAQIRCSKMLTRVLRPEVCWTAIDHANARDHITGAIRKARGARAGIPDYLFWAGGRAFAIEFKAEDGVVSANQRAFLADLAVAQVPTAVCRSSAAVFEAVKRWQLIIPAYAAAWDAAGGGPSAGRKTA